MLNHSDQCIFFRTAKSHAMKKKCSQAAPTTRQTVLDTEKKEKIFIQT